MTGFECKHCGSGHTCLEWDEATLPMCKNRKERREYIKINKAGIRRLFYKCPACGEVNNKQEMKEI